MLFNTHPQSGQRSHRAHLRHRGCRGNVAFRDADGDANFAERILDGRIGNTLSGAWGWGDLWAARPSRLGGLFGVCCGLGTLLRVTRLWLLWGKCAGLGQVEDGALTPTSVGEFEQKTDSADGARSTKTEVGRGDTH